MTFGHGKTFPTTNPPMLWYSCAIACESSKLHIRYAFCRFEICRRDHLSACSREQHHKQHQQSGLV